MAIHEVGLGAESLERLSEAVRELFPLLWFQPEQTDAFLDNLRTGEPPGRIVLVESAAGEVFVGENRGRVAFIIPADPHSSMRTEAPHGRGPSELSPHHRQSVRTAGTEQITRELPVVS